MLLGFDFDSVVVDTGTTLCCLLTEYLGYQVLPESIHHYALIKNFPRLSKAESREIIDKLLDVEHTFKTPPIDGSLDFIRWYAKTSPIHIITTRINTTAIEVYMRHHLDYNTFKQINFHASLNKGELCRELGISHFIDDCITNIINLANNGIIPVLFLRTWNCWLLSERSNLAKLIRFVNSWDDVYQLITCERENII